VYKSYKDEGNPEKDDKARAMDFLMDLTKSVMVIIKIPYSTVSTQEH
jgi:hypothetical protein